MKATLFLCLAALMVGPAQAEIFRPQAFRHPRAAHSEVRVSSHRDHGHRHRPSIFVGRHWGDGYDHGFRRFGHRYGHDFGRYRRPYRYSHVSFGYYPGYSYDYPSYGNHGYDRNRGALNGLWLGALAGGVIGHNSGEFRHDAWRGAAWGAGIGWLWGTISDANRPAAYEQPIMVQQAPAVPVRRVAASPQPQQVTIINDDQHSASPMGSANSLFGRK